MNSTDEEARIPRPLSSRLDALDRRIVDFMQEWGILALRASLGVTFIWFGTLEPLALSSAPLLLVGGTARGANGGSDRIEPGRRGGC